MPTFVFRVTAELGPARLSSRLRKTLADWVRQGHYRAWTESSDSPPVVVLTELHHVTKPDEEAAIEAVRTYLREDVARHRLPSPVSVAVTPEEPAELVPAALPPSPAEIAATLKASAAHLVRAAGARGYVLDGTRESLHVLEAFLRDHWTTTSKRGLVDPHLRGRFTWITGYLFQVLSGEEATLVVTHDGRGVGAEMPDGRVVWIQQAAKARMSEGHAASLVDAIATEGS